jgi:hypothetical protein
MLFTLAGLKAAAKSGLWRGLGADLAALNFNPCTTLVCIYLFNFETPKKKNPELFMHVITIYNEYDE